MKRTVIMALLFVLASLLDVKAQYVRSLFSDVEYDLSFQGSFSSGEYTPLWLNANKYGLSSLENTNGYLRAIIERPLNDDGYSRWDIGYGIDIVTAYNYPGNFFIQQAYLETRWLNGVFTVGSKNYPLQLKNQWLSSGSQTLGINARAIPQIRIALPEYWTLPFANDWLNFKGHIAYGMTTDENWQKDFTQCNSKYTTNTFYHSKAGYLKIGREDKPVSLELGLEMAAQFGGTAWMYNRDGGLLKVENDESLKSFWQAFIPGGSETVEDIYQNKSGNQLGSWMMRLNFDYEAWNFALYGEHFFEDHSAMFHLDYDGYGAGEQWNEKVDNRYLGYGLKDMMLGAELTLKDNPWLNAMVFEYIYSKYQSGPLYHDRTEHISDHMGGKDNYYNHYIYTGWQHWGQVMGNPLYLSPLYNTDGKIEVKNSRMYGFHFGVMGSPTDNLDYRILASWQKSFGTYDEPYDRPQENFSAFVEATYYFPETSVLNGWSMNLGLGMDKGRLRGDNYGMQLTIAKSGLLNF